MPRGKHRQTSVKRDKETETQEATLNNRKPSKSAAKENETQEATVSNRKPRQSATKASKESKTQEVTVSNRKPRQSAAKASKEPETQEATVSKRKPRQTAAKYSKETEPHENHVNKTKPKGTLKSKEDSNNDAASPEGTTSKRQSNGRRGNSNSKEHQNGMQDAKNESDYFKNKPTQSISSKKPASARRTTKLKEKIIESSAVKKETCQPILPKRKTTSAKGGATKLEQSKSAICSVKVEATQSSIPKKRKTTGVRKSKEQNKQIKRTNEACSSDESDFDMDSSPPRLIIKIKDEHKSMPDSGLNTIRKGKATDTSIVSPGNTRTKAPHGIKRKETGSRKGDGNPVVVKKQNTGKDAEIKNQSKIQQNLNNSEGKLKKENILKAAEDGGDQNEESSDDSSESDWEEVEDLPLHMVDPTAALNETEDSPKDSLEISIDVGEGDTLRSRRKQKHEEMWRRYLQWQVNRSNKELQESLHKVHLLCLLAHGLHISNLCNSMELQCIAMSHIPTVLLPRNKKGGADSYYLPKFVKWFRSSFSIDTQQKDNSSHSMQETITQRLETRKARNENELVHICILMLRALGLDVRLVVSLHPITIKPIKLTKANTKKGLSKSKERKPSAKSSQATTKKAAKKVDVPHPDTKPVCSKFFPSPSDDKPIHSNTKSKPSTSKSKMMKKTTKSEKSTQESKPLSDLSKSSGPKPKNRARRKCASKVTPIIELSSNEENSSDNDSRMAGSDDSDFEESESQAKSSRKKRKQNNISRKRSEQSDSDSEDLENGKKRRKPKSGGTSNKAKKLKMQRTENSSVEELDSDSDFDVDVIRLASGPRTSSSSTDGSAKKTSRKMLSSESDESVEIIKTKGNIAKRGTDHWLEVYGAESGWICVDCIYGNIKRPQLLESKASKPTKYIVTFDNDGSIKDVTRRYDSKWMIGTQKLRVDSEWWEDTLEPHRSQNKARDKQEEQRLHSKLLDKPLPTTISEYKNHPLYALKRHLLKFESIYPDTAAVLGYCRGEPVYARECVHELHTRQTWLKEARVVMIGEKPYKLVKARPKRNQPTETEPSLEVFGHWQTEDFIPPIAVDGVVPRNEHGNVELFKECMLPSRTVHLRFAGLNRIARKLDIDCAPAMTGWDFHGGFCHPVLDGFVVCEEFEEVLTESWYAEQQEIEKRKRKKKEESALKNWKLLIKGVLIRERLNKRFQTNHGAGTSAAENKTEKVSWPKNRMTAFEGDKNNRLPFETL